MSEHGDTLTQAFEFAQNEVKMCVGTHKTLLALCEHVDSNAVALGAFLKVQEQNLKIWQSCIKLLLELEKEKKIEAEENEDTSFDEAVEIVCALLEEYPELGSNEEFRKTLQDKAL
jgi:hypothetical protein